MPALEPDDQRVIPALAELGIDSEPAVWGDPAVDWAGFDLVVLRSPWDYIARRNDFVAWARSVPRLMNPASVVEWNTDKRYLTELAGAGVPVTPTAFIEPHEAWLPPRSGEYVIKPAISVGSLDTGRYGPSSETEAIAHLGRLQRDGRIVMVQPYLSAVDTYGETALLYFADPASGRLVFSHAIRKGPMLDGPDTGADMLYKAEQISPRVASEEELAVGEAVLAALPSTRVLYARVDLIPDAEGNPVLLEVELTEPSLFFEHGPGSPGRFAAAIGGFL